MGSSVNVEEVSADEDQLIKRCIEGWEASFVRAEGFVQTPGYAPAAEALRSAQVRADDVWLVTHPRSGTTWTQELVWLLRNNLDYEAAKSKLLAKRFPMLEVTTHIPERMRKRLLTLKSSSGSLGDIQAIDEAARFNSWDTLEKEPSPRLIKTHLPLPLLPPTVLEKAKVVYVARDPRDVAVSYYYMHKLGSKDRMLATLNEYCEMFFKELLPCSPHWKHVESAWKFREHPNMLFLMYEEMSKDLPKVAEKMAKFLGVEVTEQQIEELCNHLHIESFRKNKTINTPISTSGSKGDEQETNSQFVRKGKVGGWQESFDDLLKQRARDYMSQHPYPPEE